MPYIKASEIKELIELEDYLGEKENWSEATCKIWRINEALLMRQAASNEKARHNMRKYRATDPKYDRRKKA